MNMRRYINGRALHRPDGGVKRYALEVIDHLDGVTVIAPSSARYPWSARLWEQTSLRRETSDGVLLSLANGGPVSHPCHVVVIHDLFALRDPDSVRRSFAALNRVQLPLLVDRAAHVVTVSRHVAEELMTEFDLASDRIAIAPPGISAVFCPGDRGSARNRLGLADRTVVSALLDPTPRKKASAASELLGRIRADFPNVETITAGRTRPGTFVHPAPTARRRPEATVELGEVDDATLASMYQASDIFVSLSSGEGFGLPVVEAAASGAAIVSTPVPSLVEHAPDGAVLVDDAEGAYLAIRSLLQSPDRRSELASAAASQLGDLLWASTAATLEAVMETVERR